MSLISRTARRAETPPDQPTTPPEPEPEPATVTNPFEAEIQRLQEDGESAVVNRFALDDARSELARLLYWVEVDACRTVILTEHHASAHVGDAWTEGIIVAFWKGEVNDIAENAIEEATRRANAGRQSMGRLYRRLQQARRQEARQVRTFSLTNREMGLPPAPVAVDSDHRRPDGALVIPPPGHPDHERLMNLAMAEREAREPLYEWERELDKRTQEMVERQQALADLAAADAAAEEES